MVTYAEHLTCLEAGHVPSFALKSSVFADLFSFLFTAWFKRREADAALVEYVL